MKAGYSVRLTAGAITAGGCLGILIPPSVLLIVYGAVAGVSVVKLYAGAFFPGLMLAGLYVLYVVLMAKLFPHTAPPLSEEERRVPLPPFSQTIRDTLSNKALPGLLRALKGKNNVDVPASTLFRHLVIVLAPAIVFVVAMGLTYKVVTAPEASVEYGLQEMGSGFGNFDSDGDWNSGGLSEPEGAGSLGGLSEPAGATPLSMDAAPAEPAAASEAQEENTAVEPDSVPAPLWFWIILAIGTGILVLFYALCTLARLEVFKLLLSSFFPLAILILAVLGSIVFGFATPSEAAAMGAFGGILLAMAYKRLNFGMVKESVYLAAKTSAMVCWLFVGSAIFSAAFALLGGQEIINDWVMGMDLTPTQFLILSQVVIFLLGWPLEWTEIIVIFMPIFLPLVNHFGIDPLFFGLLVALNLQ